MQTHFRITLDSKQNATLITSINLKLKTVKFIVEDRIKDCEKSFDELDKAYLSYCFIP